MRLFPVAPEQRHDGHAVKEAATMYTVVSARDPWVSTESRNPRHPFVDEGSDDAGSSDVPSNFACDCWCS